MKFVGIKTVKQVVTWMCAGALALAALVNSTEQTKAGDPFVAGLIVGGVVTGLLHHYPYPAYRPYHRNYYRRLYYGAPAYPEPYPYDDLCVHGPRECYEKDECWRDMEGRRRCGIRRHCRRRVYCE